LSFRRRLTSDDRYEILFTIWVDDDEAVEALIESTEDDSFLIMFEEAIAYDLNLDDADFSLLGTYISQTAEETFRSGNSIGVEV